MSEYDCCSAGVGRTGTYLAVDYLLSKATTEGHVDVYKHVAELRAQRMHCVQTLVTHHITFSLSFSYHRLRGSASPVLMATGFVNEIWHGYAVRHS